MQIFEVYHTLFPNLAKAILVSEFWSRVQASAVVPKPVRDDLVQGLAKAISQTV
jgi:hypothetical protein